MHSDELRADCGRCSGLCCVALPFTRSADFAFTKPAATQCRHLESDHRCRIHAALRESGFRGCSAFDCFGAGQRVTQITFGGRSWREGNGAQMFAAFEVVRALHELLWYLDDVRDRVPASLRRCVAASYARTEALAALPADQLIDVDVAGHRSSLAEVLRDASAAVRKPGRRRYRPGTDLAGADLRNVDLADEDLRGVVLIGADLSGATFTRTDLLGADVRDARLDGADLSEALYMTRAQLGSARGDARTKLPRRLDRPADWA